MPKNDTFNQLIPVLPRELHQPFSDLGNNIGGLLQKFADTYNPRAGHVGLIMAFIAARTIADTASGMASHELPEGSPRLKEVQQRAHELMELTSNIVVMLHDDDVQDGLIEDKPCNCLACRTKKRLEAGEDIDPDELVEVLKAATEQKTGLKLNEPTPTPTSEPEHVAGTPSQSSPWYVGLGDQEQVLGSPLSISSEEDHAGKAGACSPDSKGRLATD